MVPVVEDPQKQLGAPNLDEQQERALTLMQGSRNVFLTGMAGTGKSYLVRQYIGQAFASRVDMCATTGIAALNLQQSIFAQTGLTIPAHTIYRWAGIGIGPRDGQSNEAFFDQLMRIGSRSTINAIRRIKKAEVLIIDEISMLPGRVFNYLDYHFRTIRGNDTPFGGIQMIVVGDFLQLPPVSKTGIYDWVFLSRAWHAALFQSVYLTHIHRQSDPVFISILNDFREGRVRGSSAEILQKRIAKFLPDSILRLMTHNIQVDKWNALKLGGIDAPEHSFEATESGDIKELEFLRKNLVTPQVLTLKVGARVIMTANLTAGERLLAANGEGGNVVEIDTIREKIWVRKDDGNTIAVSRYTWKYDMMRDDSGEFTQYPLRLAYAMTIHKSQGLTLDKAIVDIRAAREPGQAYVAVSRVRSLSGLWLKDSISGVFVSREAINFYKTLL